ncbi:MAG TPA: hypothetical protein PLZ11_15250 [Thauera sp.]|nr:hypothetical protein [Thauera sp.]
MEPEAFAVGEQLEALGQRRRPALQGSRAIEDRMTELTRERSYSMPKN